MRLQLAYQAHPLEYLSKIRPDNVRGQISAVMHMIYPADPLVEPEFVGCTYLQVALQRQAQQAAQAGSLEALEFFTDRIIGRPAQVNVNVNANESYADFLKKIADSEEADGGILDVKTEEQELFS